MDVDKLPKGPGGEMPSLDGRKAPNRAGVYRHEAAGKEIIVLPDPTSTAQADALVRMGFEWIGEPPTRGDLIRMQRAQAQADADAEARGESPEPYLVPGEQEVVFNGSATDVGGPGDALAAKEEENRLLREKLALLEADTDPADVEKVEAETTEIEAELAETEPAEAETEPAVAQN